MGEPLVLFPDVEALLVTFLQGRAELAGVTVGVVLPAGFDGSRPAVVLTRMGGIWNDYQRTDAPIVMAEAYGPDKPSAHRIALLVRGLLNLARYAAHAAGVVSDVREMSGPRFEPDAAHSRAFRYTTRTRVLVHPSWAPRPEFHVLSPTS